MSKTLNELSLGTSVYFKVNNVRTEFIVIHQGMPPKSGTVQYYDTSCDGTWLLSKKTHGSLVNYRWYSNPGTPFSTYYDTIETAIKDQIKQVKIPYTEATSDWAYPHSGSDGYSTKVFSLSAYELGGQGGTSNSTKLGYFESGNDSASAKAKRIPSDSKRYWTRSPDYNEESYLGGRAADVSETGVCSTVQTSGAAAVAAYLRPAMILPKTLMVDDNGNVFVNNAPSTPSTLTVPSTILGGSNITISWSASTDPDGNLAGYELQRQINSGSWSQIYKGSARTTTNTVAFGTETVRYRVRAYDTEEAVSGWKTGTTIYVTNATAPAPPSSITVPQFIAAGSNVTITWGASPDSEVTGYKLEKSTDNGSTWTQIYDGANRQYSDTVSASTTNVTYRVAAYADAAVPSAYTTSATRTVSNDQPPEITCSTPSGGNLGTKTSGFSVSYSVHDPDGDTITVTEKMDGVTKRTFTATDGATNSFAVTGEYFMKVLNGQHTMTISASDGQATTDYILYFTKSVTSASITLSTPMDADAPITVCVITVSGSIPNDATYTVEVTNNAKDASPVWENCTTEAQHGTNHIFTNTTAVNGPSFNFRVSAAEGSSHTGGYIVSIQGGFQ